MKTLALVAALAMCLSGAPKKRDWKTALLTATAFHADDRGVIGLPDNSRTAIKVTATYEGFELDAGNLIYQVMCRVSRNTPNVTVHGQVKYATDKDGFYLLDDDGREFRMTVLLKSLKTPPPAAPPK